MCENQPADLVTRAQDEYGSLITSIMVFPEDGGLNVNLIGGEGVCYFKNGSKFATWNIPFRIRVLGRLAYWQSHAKAWLVTFVEKYE